MVVFWDLTICRSFSHDVVIICTRGPGYRASKARLYYWLRGFARLTNSVGYYATEELRLLLAPRARAESVYKSTLGPVPGTSSSQDVDMISDGDPPSDFEPDTASDSGIDSDQERTLLNDGDDPPAEQLQYDPSAFLVSPQSGPQAQSNPQGFTGHP